jgi:hypothetical protein
MTGAVVAKGQRVRVTNNYLRYVRAELGIWRHLGVLEVAVSCDLG